MPMPEIIISTTPDKLVGAAAMTPAELSQQFAFAAQAELPYDQDTRGTCGDERERAHLLNGQPTQPNRPSVWGGPNIYGLYMMELAGVFTESSLSAEDRLRQTTQKLNAAGITSGGHKGCAANAGFAAIMGIIAEQSTEWEKAASVCLGEAFSAVAATEVTKQARQAVESGRYNDWTEDVLERVLGDEADEALEVLQPQEHDALTVVRQWRPGLTVSQDKLSAIAGQRSFVQDEPYCERIEDALAADDEAGQLMRHAREALLYAVEQAVPNKELWAGSLK